MADVNFRDIARPRPEEPASPSGADQDDAVIELIELLFFAYRDFTADPDAILAEFGFGRAHHRVIHFVARNPGIRVTELLAILRITKQSLGRVLKELVEQGYVEQREGPSDRRQRLLFLTDKGNHLAARLVRPQIERVSRAVAASGSNAQALYRQVLYNLIDESDRSRVAALVARSG
jgi:DNA-binding MarR family transcriptional regulator